MEFGRRQKPCVPPPSTFLTGAGEGHLCFYKSCVLSGSERWGGRERVPCSLAPGPLEEARPRPWLQGEEAWARARREVEERRERRSREEQAMAEEARRRLGREESEAVREARSRELDRRAAEDWAYQVLLREKVKREEREEDLRRVQGERRQLAMEEEVMKREERERAVLEIEERARQGNRARREREEALVRRRMEQGEERVGHQREHMEEEKEKAEKKRIEEKRKLELGSSLRRQMLGEEARRMREAEVRESEEGRERRRRVELGGAGGREREEDKVRERQERDDFCSAREGLGRMQLRGLRDEARAFIEDSRRVEEILVEREEERERRVQEGVAGMVAVLQGQVEEKVLRGRKEGEEGGWKKRRGWCLREG